MIPPLFPHKRFLCFVGNKARHHGGLRANHRHFHVWRKLQKTNLDAAYPILASLYAEGGIGPALALVEALIVLRKSSLGPPNLTHQVQ